MWWADIRDLCDHPALQGMDDSAIDPSVVIEPGARLDSSAGPIAIGAGSRICSGALLRGPLAIGRDCLIGNQAIVRGPCVIGAGVRIGFCAEVKHALIGDEVSIGPMCFVADSRIDRAAYLGALVRTSNHRLDRQPVTVLDGATRICTALEKLGCWIGHDAALGIQTIVLPGRVIAPGTVFEPRITVARNLPAGHYRLAQHLETI